jgi:hypothetical protein
MPSRGDDLAVETHAEPGSFRDPDSRVYLTPQGVFRVLSASGVEDWQALEPSRLWGELQKERRVVATEAVPAGQLPEALPTDGAAVLRHERIPFVSYPYEWPFTMLQDAALLQLELNRRALREDLTLKDASAYNVQFRGSEPVFIDVGSFEKLRPNEPWAGYRQFCMLFLFPLMLQAYKDLPYHALLRGAIDGIPPAHASAILSSRRDRMRKGVFANVSLHARLESRYAAVSGREVKRDMGKAGFSKELLDANLRKLEKVVGGLRWKAGDTAWTGYGDHNTYDGESAAEKAAFVREAAARRPGGLTWDLGCNDGTYTRIAAESSDGVVAVDADHATVDALYRALRKEKRTDILPLVMSLTDPSPDLGWRGRERASLERRGTPDLTLALALIHHVAITGNVPVRDFLAWVRSLDTALVIEFPDRSDPMVQRLLSGKNEDANPDYEKASFERALEEQFEVDRSAPVSETRTLYEARPRA